MKNLLHHKVFRACIAILLAAIVILLLFRIPTRISAAKFNSQTTLPVGLLETGVDWSEYTYLGGFGMRAYRMERNTGTIEYQVSSWPDTFFGKQKVDHIFCWDTAVTVCGLSVGDDITQAENVLRQYGFRPTENRNQYVRFGVILTINTDGSSTKIHQIVIGVSSTNILGFVY